MTFPNRRRNWKRVRPNSLRDAFRLCKEHARERKNFSVDHLAELLDVSVDVLYKWLSNASMPSGKIPSYEAHCGIRLVSEYLAASGGRVVIDIPTGRASDALELNEFQAVVTDAMGTLMRFYRGEAGLEETEAGLTEILKGAAWHRENIARHEQPELGFEVME